MESIGAASIRSSRRSPPHSTPIRWCIRFCSRVPTLTPTMVTAQAPDGAAEGWAIRVAAAEATQAVAATQAEAIRVAATPTAGVAGTARRCWSRLRDTSMNLPIDKVFAELEEELRS